MKRNYAPVLILLTTVFGAIALTALRYYQLWHCMDENGLLIRGSRVAWGFVGLIAVVIAALVLLLVGLDKTDKSEASFRGSMVWNLLSAAAAAALMVGCALRSFATPLNDTAHLMIYTAGVAFGALLVISDALRIWGKKSNLFLLLLPCLFLAARLIFDFKDWSHDPIIIDFCFKLLSSITAMLACFNLAGFPIGCGKRRTTILFCMLCFVFSSMTVSDCLLQKGCSIGDLIIYVSLGVWSLINGLMLLFRYPKPSLTEEPTE